MSSGTVCVVGAGMAGLVSARTLQEDGFKVTVFEARPSFGGLWRFQDYVYCKSNNPWPTYCFSSVPMEEPAAADKTMVAAEMADYFKKYVEVHDLGQIMHFNSKVIS